MRLTTLPGIADAAASEELFEKDERLMLHSPLPTILQEAIEPASVA